VIQCKFTIFRHFQFNSEYIEAGPVAPPISDHCATALKPLELNRTIDPLPDPPYSADYECKSLFDTGGA